MADTREERLIWVDEQDREIGTGEKLDTHRRKQLHRAFSIFIADPDTGALLLQMRAPGKYHSGGLWTNSCCSHPRQGQTMAQALHDRLLLELGIDVPLHIEPGAGGAFGPDAALEAGSFRYFADFGELAEHELDHVYVLYQSAAALTLHPDPEEIAQCKWVTPAELDAWMEVRPQDFTAWFGPAYALARSILEKR